MTDTTPDLNTKRARLLKYESFIRELERQEHQKLCTPEPFFGAEPSARKSTPTPAAREARALVRCWFAQMKVAERSAARINDPKQCRKLTPAQHEKIRFNLDEALETTRLLLALSRGDAAPTPTLTPTIESTP